MIFYFTGTGNSLAAARQLLDTDEALINMADAIRDQRYHYQVKQGEKVGFVFPVYFYSLPVVVIDFIDNLILENADYIYSVITCGGGISQAGAVLKKKLARKNLHLNYMTELLMPDNYILLYENKAVGWETCLSLANEKLEVIAEDISRKKCIEIGSNTIVSDLMAIMYRYARNTSKFYAEETCIGCGKCEENCPEKVIKLINGKPVWEKEKCVQCLACINRCPVRAIQYGKRTKHQGRYVHPDM